MNTCTEKNPSGITARPSSDHLTNSKEFTFHRNGAQIAAITLYFDGDMWIQQASSIHIQEKKIVQVSRHHDKYCDISLHRL